MLVSLVPLTDTPEAQSRSGLEHLHLRKHRRHNKLIIYTYLITLTITLAIVSPRVVTQAPLSFLSSCIPVYIRIALGGEDACLAFQPQTAIFMMTALAPARIPPAMPSISFP